ncbi:hypothetical protein EON65_52525 [archaeon]|nr:MAG: hypothetical protein EON65_52525 [archaeon]
MNWQQGQKYIPPTFYDNLAQGLIYSHELEKMFSPNKLDLDLMLKRSSTGFVGLVFSVESGLVDLSEAYWTGLMALSHEQSRTAPSIEIIKEVAGLPLKDAFIALGWHFRSLEDEMLAATLVYNVMNDFVEKNDLQALSGVPSLLHRAIQEGNQVSIITNLPRELAVKALYKAHLSPLLQGRVPENHLLFPFCLTPTEHYYALERYQFLTRYKQYVEACGVMHMSPAQCVGFDTQRTAIIEAKRVGMSAIGIRGDAQSSFMLRGADKVVNSLEEVNMEGVYRVVRRGLEISLGPAQQLSSELKDTGGRWQKTLTPMLEPGSQRKVVLCICGFYLMVVCVFVCVSFSMRGLHVIMNGYYSFSLYCVCSITLHV